jgi:hypothetical protein
MQDDGVTLRGPAQSDRATDIVPSAQSHSHSFALRGTMLVVECMRRKETSQRRNHITP